LASPDLAGSQVSVDNWGLVASPVLVDSLDLADSPGSAPSRQKVRE
jgi:hypothetical protein